MKIFRIAFSLVVLVSFALAALPVALAEGTDSPAAAAADKKIAEYTALIAKNPASAPAYYFRGGAY